MDIINLIRFKTPFTELEGMDALISQTENINYRYTLSGSLIAHFYLYAGPVS